MVFKIRRCFHFSDVRLDPADGRAADGANRGPEEEGAEAETVRGRPGQADQEDQADRAEVHGGGAEGQDPGGETRSSKVGAERNASG